MNTHGASCKGDEVQVSPKNSPKNELTLHDRPIKSYH